MGQLGVKSSRSLIGWTAKMAHSHVKGLSGEGTGNQPKRLQWLLRVAWATGLQYAASHCEHFKT